MACPTRTCLSVAALAVSALPAFAGTVIGFTFADDAGSQISSSKTYTAKADPGTGGGVATVNGVVFDAGTLAGTVYSAPGFTYSSPAAFPLIQHGGNTFDLPSGTGMSLLLTDMVYTNVATGLGNVTTLTFSGLTTGLQYSARIYYRAWDAATPRISTLNFDEDGAGPLGASAGAVDEDAPNGPADNVANVIGYNYTAVAGQPLVVTFTQAADNNSWHLYGVTNEVIPEPSAGLLSAAGVLGLLSRRRRVAN